MKRMGFQVLRQMQYSRPVFFHRGEAKLLSMIMSQAWESNRLEESELSDEFFELLKQAPLAKEMLQLVHEPHQVEEAKSEIEILSRQMEGRPVGAYSYNKTYLRITFTPETEYRIWLESDDMDDAGAVRDLLDTGCVVRSSAERFAIQVPGPIKDPGSHSSDYVEVVRSPLLEQIRKEQTADK